MIVIVLLLRKVLTQGFTMTGRKILERRMKWVDGPSEEHRQFSTNAGEVSGNEVGLAGEDVEKHAIPNSRPMSEWGGT
jgi:hypothetical protein